MKRPSSLSPVLIYVDEIKQPFFAMACCCNCPRQGFMYFPLGRAETKLFDQGSRCDLCGHNSVFFSAPIVTGN